jgi:type IV pilus assembly protein PilW
VVTVRMSLLLHSPDPVASDLPVPASGPVGLIAVNYPTTGRKYDRRVFTTTIAVRNKTAYFP